MPKDLKAKISKWRESIGYDEAKARLIAACVSESVAQKLLAGTYPNKPKGLLMNAIQTAMDNS